VAGHLLAALVLLLSFAPMNLEFPISRLAIMRDKIEIRLLEFLQKQASSEIDALKIEVEDFNLFRLSIGIKKFILPTVWLSVQIKVVSDEIVIDPKKKTELVLEIMEKNQLVKWLEKFAGNDMLYKNPDFDFDGKQFRMDLYKVLKAEEATQILSDLQLIRLVLSENVLNVLFYPHGIDTTRKLDFRLFLAHASEYFHIDEEVLEAKKKKDLIKDIGVKPGKYRAFVINTEHKYNCLIPYHKSKRSNRSIKALYKSFAVPDGIDEVGSNDGADSLF